MPSPRIPVADLRINTNLARQTFLLRQKTIITTRSGTAILQLTLADRTGSISAVYFDPPESLASSLVPGEGVDVAGYVAEFKDQPQITIERIWPVQLNKASLEEFLPVAKRPLDEMRDELDALLASVTAPDLQNLLNHLFGEPDGHPTDIYRAFVRWPAAKVHHHACIGGLLEHTLSVARLVQAACDLYPELDRDLVVTVALLHDLGKIRTYDPVTFGVNNEGSLWTHLYSSASMVERAIDELPDFDPDLKLQVVHALLAHHGKREYGSPAIPMTLEAIVLYHADSLDGDARGALDHFARSQTDDEGFTERSLMHDTRLFRGRSSWG